MKQKIQKHNHDAPEKLDLFRDTFRGKMPLTDDYVFHAVFGRDTAESKGALMEILNIILARKQDPIRAIVIKNPIETPEREMEKGTVMDIKAETDAGELLNIEMQANSFSFYQSRALFYGGRLVNSSLQGGEKYDKMRKSIVVSIIDGNLFPELEFLSQYLCGAGEKQRTAAQRQSGVSFFGAAKDRCHEAGAQSDRS